MLKFIRNAEYRYVGMQSISIHLMLKFISTANKANVRVARISIHLMLKFIDFAKDIAIACVKFQYISC